MGKNILTSWLVVTGKDFKILYKNRYLFLIYLAVVLSIILLALFIGLYLAPVMLSFFPPNEYLPALPNFMVYFVIFTSTLYLMSMGAASFTKERELGTSDRIKTMNILPSTMIFGKMFFYYLVALIQAIIFNGISIFFFYEVNGMQIWMNWNVSNFFEYVFLWPLVMVCGAGVLFALVTQIGRTTRKAVA